MQLVSKKGTYLSSDHKLLFFSMDNEYFKYLIDNQLLISNLVAKSLNCG